MKQDEEMIKKLEAKAMDTEARAAATRTVTEFRERAEKLEAEIDALREENGNWQRIAVILFVTGIAFALCIIRGS